MKVSYFLLLFTGDANYFCYHCAYHEVDGLFEADEESDINCKSNPSLTGSVECMGECVTLEFNQRINFFGEFNSLIEIRVLSVMNCTFTRDHSTLQYCNS